MAHFARELRQVGKLLALILWYFRLHFYFIVFYFLSAFTVDD